MKKTLIVITIIFLSFSFYSKAFTLHSGIEFYTPIEDVIEFEKQKGYEIISRSVGDPKESGNLYDLYDEANFFYGKGTIVGADDSYVAYFPDDQGKIFRMQYVLKPERENYILMVYDVLEDKYGEADYEYGETPPYINSDVKNRRSTYIMDINDLPSTYSGWDEIIEMENEILHRGSTFGCTWIIEEEGKNIVIDFAELYFTKNVDGETKTEFGYYITYTIVGENKYVWIDEI